MQYKDAIKLVRTKMILSQTEFAEKLGVSFVTINRYENGKYIPTIKVKRNLQKYFDKYGLKVEE